MQTIREQRQLKVQIGKHYTGPAFDRPAIRSTNLGLRSDFTLEESKPPRRISPDGWVLAAAIMGWLFCFVQTALEMSK